MWPRSPLGSNLQSVYVAHICCLKFVFLLRALSGLLRRRGSCVVRAAADGIPGPLRLPLRQSSMIALSHVSEALSLGAHGEVGELALGERVCWGPGA